jgi:hypothetical protein
MRQFQNLIAPNREGILKETLRCSGLPIKTLRQSENLRMVQQNMLRWTQYQLITIRLHIAMISGLGTLGVFFCWCSAEDSIFAEVKFIHFKAFLLQMTVMRPTCQ